MATLSYTPLEKLQVSRPVDRISYIRDACEGRRVLDLGAMDETAFNVKRGSGSWLHEEVAAVATSVVGLDSSPVVPSEGLKTSARSTIFRGDVYKVGDFLTAHGFTPDVVVAGELIEHVENPLVFLKSFTTVPALRGKRLLLTTPNATAIHNFLIAMTKRESTHADHLSILSYKTLNTLLSRAGVGQWRLIPYYSRFYEMKSRCAGARLAAVDCCEKVINLAETLCPLVSFGLICDVTI